MSKKLQAEQERLGHIRNVGVIAHIDAGKTTVSERMMYYTHKIHRMGEVHDGNATMDFMPEEQERGITISAASTYCTWNEHTLNLIDTPGHVDFTIEVERSLRVLDGAVGVFCAVGGVEPQSETVWRQAENLDVPRIVFINKMDRIGADFEYVLASMRDKLSANPIAIQIPLGQGEEFYAVADLISQKKLEFDEEDQGESFYIVDLDDEELALVASWREKMLEALADVDDEFLQAYLSEEYDENAVHQALRRACVQGLAQPCLVGSALKNTGIQPLLDAICAYLPSPLDVYPLKSSQDASIDTQDQENNANNEKDSSHDCLALVFKVLLENKRKIALLRLYQGELSEGMAVYNRTQSVQERMGRMYLLHADFREQVELAKAGEIVAVIGLKSVKTGDTLGISPKGELLESLSEYKPVISLAFEPKNSEDALVLDEALERYALEDPTLAFQIEEVSGARLVSGMGELHLDVLRERLIREYKIEPRVGHPQVILRETVKTEGQAHILFDKTLGESRHYAELSLKVSPTERGSGNKILFADDCFELPESQNAKPLQKEYTQIQEIIQKSLEDSLHSGPETGYPVQDVLLEVTNVKKEPFSTLVGYEAAASLAVKEALQKANIMVLHPIMQLEVQCPEESLGSCINLINTCGGKIEQLEDRAGQKYISALAPMTELFGFSTRIRSVSQGRAGMQIRFYSYDV